MSKRFTDTSKWSKPFLRGMKAPYKLLWLYILDECNHAGIWQVDFEVAQLKIGEKLNREKALEFFGPRVFQFDGGDKWFIFDFIDFQYGELNPQNRAHNSVITILNKYEIDFKNKDLYKGLVSPLQGAKDKDKDKDMVKDKGGVRGENSVSENSSPKVYYRVIKHLKIEIDEFDKLVAEGWTKEQIDDILDKIENYAKNNKYTNLLTTARNWLKKEHAVEVKPNHLQQKVNAHSIVKQQIEDEFNAKREGNI